MIMGNKQEAKEIMKILSKIKPTKEEVTTMCENDWINLIYPIKCFNAGVKFAKSQSEVKEDG